MRKKHEKGKHGEPCFPLMEGLFEENHVPSDIGQGFGTAHGHGVRQLAADFVDVELHAFLRAAVDRADEGRSRRPRPWPEP